MVIIKISSPRDLATHAVTGGNERGTKYYSKQSLSSYFVWKTIEEQVVFCSQSSVW